MNRRREAQQRLVSRRCRVGGGRAGAPGRLRRTRLRSTRSFRARRVRGGARRPRGAFQTGQTPSSASRVRRSPASGSAAPAAASGSPDLDLPIEDLDLSERPRNCLKRAQVNSVGELLTKSEDDLLAITNFGQKSLDEVIVKLDERGLSLRGSRS